MMMMTIISGDFMTIKLGLSRVLVTTIQRQKSFISQQEVSAKAVSYFEKQRSINSWHDNCDKFHNYGSDDKFPRQFLLRTGKFKDYPPLTREELKAPQIYHSSSNKVTANFDCLSHHHHLLHCWPMDMIAFEIWYLKSLILRWNIALHCEFCWQKDMSHSQILGKFEYGWGPIF